MQDLELRLAVLRPHIFMVVGAVLVGYATCMLQQGFGPSLFSNTQQPIESEFKHREQNKEKPTPLAETTKEEPGWPSFGQLIIDLSKLALEALGNIFLYFIPSRFTPRGSKGLTPLKDSLIMPDNQPEPPQLVRTEPPQLVRKQTTPTPITETQHVRTATPGDKYSEMKPPKMRSSSFKDPSSSTKHRSSKRQEYAEFYASGEIPPYSKSKSQKERTRHRQRDKSGEVGYGVSGVDPKPVDMKPADYDNLRYERYNMRKYADSTFRF